VSRRPSAGRDALDYDDHQHEPPGATDLDRDITTRAETGFDHDDLWRP